MAIVVGGVSKLKADVNEAKAIRPTTSSSIHLDTRYVGNSTESIELQMGLYGGDIIETGDNTYVTIVFATMDMNYTPTNTNYGNDNSAETDEEVIIYPNTRVTIGSIWTWGGRILNRVRGFFDAGGKNVSGATGGTEFFINVKDGKTELIVLDGHVNALVYDLVITEAPILQAFTIKNLCRETHEYSVEEDQIHGLFLVPDRLTLNPGAEGTIVPQIKSNGGQLESKTYHGNINIHCLDCHRERGCNVDITKKGKKSEDLEPLAIDVTIEGSNVVKKLEKVDIVKGNIVSSRKSSLTLDDATNMVIESNGVIVAAQSVDPIKHVLPHFLSHTERANAFKEARLKALLNNERSSYETLMRVYLDWGKGAKALEAYEKALIGQTAIKESVSFKVNKGEAYRLIGNLEKALAEINGAITIDGRSFQAFNALGNIYFDQTRGAIFNGDRADAQIYLDQAQSAYSKAIDLIEKPLNAKAQFYKAVLLTNLGDVYSLQRDMASERQAPIAIINNLRNLALQSYTSAAASNAEYVYALTELGFSYLDQGITSEFNGDAKSANERYNEARKQFEKAVNLNPMLGEAHAGLAVFFLKNNSLDSAQKEFSLAVKLNRGLLVEQVLLPDFEGQPLLMAIRNVLAFGLIPILDGDGPFVTEQNPESATLTLIDLDKVTLKTKKGKKKK